MIVGGTENTYGKALTTGIVLSIFTVSPLSVMSPALFLWVFFINEIVLMKAYNLDIAKASAISVAVMTGIIFHSLVIAVLPESL